MFHRRSFLEAAAFSSACWAIPGVFAEELVRTPAQTEGPFYPDKLPLDTDNDLLIINEKITPAVGIITHLTGHVYDSRGNPVKNATVEIWQCDANGAYLHSRTGNKSKQDGNFQGFGRFLTSKTGEYYFRTIKPVPYPGRTPHIHFKINHGGKVALVTQCYIKGEAQNERDGIYKSLRDPKQREAVTVDFAPVKTAKIPGMVARFNIVLGITPELPS